MDILQDHLRLEVGEPGHEVVERHVPADDHMVHQREAEDEVRPRAVRQRPPLGAAPAESGRRVGDVRDQRKDVPAVAVLLQGGVQPVDHQVVGVEGEHGVGVLRRDARVDAGVAADIPRQRPPPRRRHAPHERLLAVDLRVVVTQFVLIAGPGGPGRPPRQAFHRAPQPRDVVPDQRGAEARIPQFAPDVAVGPLVARLRLRLQDDVREDAGPQPVAQRQAAAALLGRDPFQAAAQPRMERHVAIGLEEQRIEEGLAELPVPGPRIAGRIGGERSDVDERGTRADPLHVERRGVLQGHLLVEGGEGQVELQQRSVAQHAERPFVGVGDDRHALVFEDGGPSVRRRRRRRERIAVRVDLACRDQMSRLGEAGEETGGGKLGPVGERPLGQAAKYRAVTLEDAGVGIAERPRFDQWRGSRIHGATARRDPVAFCRRAR